jgi:hypothetical protein
LRGAASIRVPTRALVGFELQEQHFGQKARFTELSFVAFEQRESLARLPSRE